MSLVAPNDGEVEPDDRAMFYSVSAIKLVEDFKDRLGRMAKNSALEHARREGRTVVTNDDVQQIIDQVEGQFGDLILDEDG